MFTSLWYDKKGKPITQKEAMPLFEDNEYRRVAFEQFPDGDYVSTVWLGLDHGFGKKPLIFETMSFENGDWNECRRYGTEEEALKGHKEIVELVSGRQGPYRRKIEIDNET